MSEWFVVSVFVDESPDKEMNKYIGGRFIPYIYEIMQKHQKVIFLLPYCSKSIARTVRVVSRHNAEAVAKCWSVCCNSVEGLHQKMADRTEGFYERCVLFKGSDKVPLRKGKMVRNEKMVDLSDLSLFFIEKQNGRVHNTMKYAGKIGKEYVIMK